ncbi:hypothetical protein C4J81_17270 [Deltaproteobacteria bacterium Smac51]|nr:hypothetical protein C4J81_17270 [Deltaproteobacteria bacterium Smac51]
MGIAYLNGSGTMTSLNELYETLSVLEHSMGGMAFILDQMLVRVILDLDVEQQNLLYFISDTLKGAKAKMKRVCPDGSEPRFEMIGAKADE